MGDFGTGEQAEVHYLCERAGVIPVPSSSHRSDMELTTTGRRSKNAEKEAQDGNDTITNLVNSKGTDED